MHLATRHACCYQNVLENLSLATTPLDIHSRLLEFFLNSPNKLQPIPPFASMLQTIASDCLRLLCVRYHWQPFSSPLRPSWMSSPLTMVKLAAVRERLGKCRSNLLFLVFPCKPAGPSIFSMRLSLRLIQIEKLLISFNWFSIFSVNFIRIKSNFV